MKKKLSSLIFLCLFLFMNISYGFFHKKSNVFFVLTAKNPILIQDFDKELKDANVFKVNDKIFYTIYTQDGFKSDYIKYQIIKQDDNAHIGGYTRIRNVTKKVDDKNYFSDYFVLSQKGKYFIQIFDITNLNHWLAMRPFMVVE